VSGPGPLRPGPALKTPAWRGGSLALGVIGLLWIADVLTGGFVSLLGFGSTALLLLLGLALSIPYGRAWLAGDPPTPRRPGDYVPVGEVRAEGGATLVVVTDGRRRNGVRSRELTPGWYVLYVLFWRAPMALGDYVLCGLWTLLGAAMGRDRRPRLDDSIEPAELPEPGRIEF
jgi:hypothetical protein